MHHSTYGSKLLAKVFFVVLAWTISFQSLNAQTNPAPNEADNQRYLALMLLNVLDKDEQGPELDLIRSAHAYGMNAVYLTIPWDKIYYNSPTDKPLWDKFDQQIKTATDLGMKVALRIHLGRHSTRIKGFWEPSDSHQSSTGKPVLSGYQDTSFGFDNQPVIAKAQAFVKETVTRYKHLQTNKQLLFVSITTTGTQEGEYPAGLIENGKEGPAVYDYSRSMITGFREFLKIHYKKLQRLNYLWGVEHKTFEDVLPPATPWEPGETFRQRAGKDWYSLTGRCIIQGTITSRFFFRYPSSTALATRSGGMPFTEEGRTCFSSLPRTAFSLNAVRTYPGQTVSTWMPSFLSSIAAPFPMAFRANLLAL